jgi:hypothetical protein
VRTVTEAQYISTHTSLSLPAIHLLILVQGLALTIVFGGDALIAHVIHFMVMGTLEDRRAFQQKMVIDDAKTSQTR